MASRAIGLTIKIENTDQDTPNQTHVLASCREIKNAKDLITPSPIANQTRLCSEADGKTTCDVCVLPDEKKNLDYYNFACAENEGYSDTLEKYSEERAKAVAAKRCDGDGDEGDDSDSDSEEEYESDGESDSDSDSDDEE
ncbi:hypothetical protein N7448_000707 [Penicillium atrosanguineum]|uniref:uncharacterized protein n=1 Tax=Penicillium atrosanguineum TaxID=1132637 RepID=UPI00239E839A|nr:uncharacterized protein N7443_004104 [Penicillium atrosanguineum]KAJ5134269.1 hypothetical protein N7526_005634 [Penicillium atrosanguineum]KAJ5149129.1 hypothetical protein N7448_000707 [Penicillium atrosanguineum]KAJ5304444.1 hypothetical protein N7443_004104 [Penicillium atrosanguineum]